ncbi:MAG TPA: O-antigen ligase family protein [Chryseolinea sp.]|nr:O-antigen ligase family protein [Chryseolinea sp.]
MNLAYTIDRSLVQYYVGLGTLSLASITLPFSTGVCHAAIVLYLLNWAFEGNWREKFSVIRSNVLIILIIVLFIMELFGTLYTDAAGVSGLEKKVFFVLLPVALATSEVKLTMRNIYQILYCFVASCLIGTFICLANASYQITLLTEGTPLAILSYLDASDYKNLNYGASDGWLSFSYVSLASGIGIHPTYFSLYLAFAITFLLYRLDDGRVWLRIVSWILIGYFSFFIVLLSSRIIIVGILAIFVIAIIQALRSKKTWTKALCLVIIVSLSGSLLYLNPVSRYRNLQEIPLASLHIQSNSNYINSTEIRASLWWMGLKASERVNLIWGTGTDDVHDAMKQVSNDYHVTNSLESYDPHNQFLFTLIGSGIIGLTLLIALMAFSLFHALVNHDYLYATFIFLFILLCTTETALQLQKGIVFFAIFFSLLAFKKRTTVPTAPTLNTV